MWMVGRVCGIVVAAVVLAVGIGGSAQAATERLRYSPLDADGTLRDGLGVNLGGTAECTSRSFIVVGAYRCFEGNQIRSVCYPDSRDVEGFSVLCVSSPWARAAIRLQLDEEPDDSFAARPGGLPWALELASGVRCVWVGGATNVVGRLRLNYGCARGRYLFGSPDRSGPTWRIRQARDFNGRAMRKVVIRVAWR
jgi:hypothetical protein